MKNEIKNAFEKITPVRSDDEVLSYVLRRSKDMEKVTEKKKISFKKPIIAICAATVTATLCITGAAAAGLFSFDDIFGSRIKAEKSELGDALMCRAENFTYTVSDDAYKIELNGISGSGTEIIANLEISKVDGTPVVDSFVNEYNPEIGLYGHEECSMTSYKGNDFNRHMGGTGKYSINNEGNIEIVYVIGSTEIDALSVANESIKISGAKLFPIEPYFDFMSEENNTTYSLKEGKLTYYENNTDNVIELDTSSVHYLDLFWTAEFTYIPSEEALKTISRGIFGVEDELECTSHIYDENYNKIEFDSTVNFRDIKLTSTYATVTFDLEYELNGYSDIPFPNIEQAYLIRKDGSKTLMLFNSGHGAHTNGYSITFKYCSYYKDNGDGSHFADYIAVDLNDAVGIEINGKVYNF